MLQCRKPVKMGAGSFVLLDLLKAPKPFFSSLLNIQKMKHLILFISILLFSSLSYAQGGNYSRGKSTTINKKKLARRTIGKSKFYVVKDSDLAIGKNVMSFPNGVDITIIKTKNGANRMEVKKGNKLKVIKLTGTPVHGNTSYTSGTDTSGYNCNGDWCDCTGHEDCNRMFTGTACRTGADNQPYGICYDDKDGVTHCTCTQEQ